MKKKWSHYVTTHSHAMDLEPGVFTQDDPKGIARSLKRSAERSTRRKAEPERSAMSMLNLYINRAGKNLTRRHREVLERAKDELRTLFDGTRSATRPARMKKLRKPKARRISKSARAQRGSAARRRR